MSDAGGRVDEGAARHDTAPGDPGRSCHAAVPGPPCAFSEDAPWPPSSLAALSNHTSSRRGSQSSLPGNGPEGNVNGCR